MRIHTITVDPGVRGAGFAYWGLWKTKGYVKPERANIFTPKGLELEQRGRQLFNYLRMSIKAIGHSVHVVVEWPQYFDSAKGHTAAVRGDLLKLTLAASTLASAGWAENCGVTLLPVNVWKGQLTKKIVERRVMEKLECEKDKYQSHAIDAVGMGLYLQEKVRLDGIPT